MSGASSLPSKGRWPMLAVMVFANALPEFLWSNLPPIMTQVVDRYHVGPTMAGLSVLSFSIGTVAVSRLAGNIIDRHGYRSAVLIGMAIASVFAALRVVEGSFLLLIIAQTGIGAALPFVTAATSSYVIDWFDKSQESRVTGICMVGLFAGLGISMIVSPILARELGFSGLMRVIAIGTATLCAVSLPFVRQRLAPRRKGRSAQALGLAWVLSNRTLTILLITSLLTQGVFSALAAGLEFVWVEHRFTPEDAGLANGLFILGGTVGSLVLPALHDRYGKGKALLVLCYVAAVVFTYPLFATHSLVGGAIIAIALGVCWLGNAPVTLTLLERSVGPEFAGIASGYYWGLGNVGVIALIPVFNGLLEFVGWRWAVTTMVGLMGACLAVTIALPRGIDQRWHLRGNESVKARPGEVKSS
jgi:MFS family permease